MKKSILVILILCIATLGSLFAMNQSLSLGILADTYDLLEPDDLSFTLIPNIEYKFGTIVENAFTGFVYADLPYKIGDDFDTLFPSAQVGINYRIQSQKDAPFINMGLTTNFSQNQQPTTTTTLSALAHFYWYPYNQTQEYIVHNRYEELVEGIRFGFGLDVGADVNNLLETPDIATDLNGALVGRLLFGSSLSDHVWFFSNTTITLPHAKFELGSFSYMLGADAHSNIQLAYMGKSFQMCVGALGSFSLNKIYTSAGFLTENTYSYGFTLYGELSYFIIPRLNVLGGARFTGARASLDDEIYAYVSVNYFLI
ncbi:MAG: hypothetical protein RBQ79_02005 [Sphaerochaetaceae bacterium]|nr:hypothetical protein [Sphaerochaetaceae bacterium]